MDCSHQLVRFPLKDGAERAFPVNSITSMGYLDGQTFIWTWDGEGAVMLFVACNFDQACALYDQAVQRGLR